LVRKWGNNANNKPLKAYIITNKKQSEKD